MHRFASFVCCVVAIALLGCKKEATFTEPIGDFAGITWANLVPDTGKLDVRVIDIPSNAGLFQADFRTSLIYPTGIQAGTRHIKVFIHSTNPDTAKLFLVDTTFTFIVDEPYSFYVAGFARAGATPRVRAVITPATLPTVGATQFAVRVLNLTPSLAGATTPDTTVAVDAWIKPVTATATGTPEVSNLAFGAVSPYVVLDTGRYEVALTATGTGAAPFVAAPVLPGTRGTPSVDAIGGSIVAGTVLTAVILPRSVPGSKAPQGGLPTARATDTTAAEASRRMFLSGDTVTVQSGSARVLVNRSGGKADSTLGGTGTRAATGVARGDVVFVSGATQPEYNGWVSVLAVADSLSCSPVDPGDTAARCNAANDTATTRFRFRYKIATTPTSPATGTPVYRIYPPIATSDFTKPYTLFMVDKRPPSTTP